MDTINNVTSAATKAIWGSSAAQQQEPVSGYHGNTNQGEPFDAGNMDPKEVNTATPLEKQDQLGHSKASAVGKPELADDKSEHINKPVSADSSVGGQHDTRDPTENPEENPVPEAELEKPGPKPLEAVARERGGDAGNVPGENKSEGAVGPSAPSGDTEQESKNKGDDQGTGEKYIKSSGLAAEGGDFDAAKAGAGREADRLLEEEGHEPGGQGSKSRSDSGGEKKSLKEKIKAKLHKHKE